jgi:DNA-binding NarL/FixJ family response regulator
MSTVRVLIADDHPDFIQSAARFLSRTPQIEIVGCVLTSRGAVDLARYLKPDLVLIDLVMPEMSGLQATVELKTLVPPPRVIVLTLNDLAEYRLAAQAAGADGFVSKSELGRRLLPTIESLFAEVFAQPINLAGGYEPT